MANRLSAMTSSTRVDPRMSRRNGVALLIGSLSSGNPSRLPMASAENLAPPWTVHTLCSGGATRGICPGAAEGRRRKPGARNLLIIQHRRQSDKRRHVAGTVDLHGGGDQRQVVVRGHVHGNLEDVRRRVDHTAGGGRKRERRPRRSGEP